MNNKLNEDEWQMGCTDTLFKFFADEHNLILTDGELGDIIDAVNAFEQSSQPQSPSDMYLAKAREIVMNNKLNEAAEKYAKTYTTENPFTGNTSKVELEDVKSKFIQIINWYAQFQSSQPQSQVSVIPSDAYNLEVFAIKQNDEGKKEAYIGYKISNGNFEFLIVPYTEPQLQVSDEDAEAKFVEKLIGALPDYGIDTSLWEYDYGEDCNDAVEFLARCITGYAKTPPIIQPK